MVSIDDAIIARIKKGGETFEVLVDCDKALEFRAGTIDSLDEVLATRDIYKDVKQGEHAPEHLFKKIFQTEDPTEIATIIIKEGEIQLTTEHKQKLRDEKTKQIVQLVHRNAINPKNGAPHPVETVKMAMDEAKIKIDEFKPAEAQVADVIAKLTHLIPIKVETREIEVVITAKFAGSAFGNLKRMGKIMKNEWQNDGSLKAVLEIPAGIQEELEADLNKMTKGDFEIKILSKK